MNRHAPVLHALLLTALATGRLVAQASGDLDPGQGNGALDGNDDPQPSMKTLAIIEPRTPILAVPITIATPGSYYLAGSLTTASDGIIIRASNVSIDLNGFTLTGTNTQVARSGVRIDGNVGSLINSVTVKNGRIVGFGTGIEIDITNDCRIENVDVRSPGNWGIQLNGGQNTCNGNVVYRCSVRNSGSNGIQLLGRTGECNANTIEECTVRNAGGSGIILLGDTGGQANGNSIINCKVFGAGGTGITIDGTPSGTCSGNLVRGNSLRSVSSTALVLDQASQSLIQDNYISNITGVNTVGVRSLNGSTLNHIVKNFVMGATTPFSPSGTDTVGPVISANGTLGGGNPANHPWANFAR